MQSVLRGFAFSPANSPPIYATIRNDFNKHCDKINRHLKVEGNPPKNERKRRQQSQCKIKYKKRLAPLHPSREGKQEIFK